MRSKLTTEQLLMRIVSIGFSVSLIIYGGYGIFNRVFKFTPEAGSRLVITGDSALYLGIGFILAGILMLWIIIRNWHLYPNQRYDKNS